MPIKIPQYEQQTTAEGLINAQARSAYEPDKSGLALENMGNAISKGTGIYSHALRQKEDGDASIYAGKVLSDAHQQWYTYQQEQFQKAADGAPDFTKNVMGEYDKWAEETSKSVSNPVGQKILANGLQSLRQSLFDSSLHLEAKAGVDFRMNGVQKAAQDYGRMVFSGQMPLDQAQTNVDTMIANGSFDPVTRAKLAETFRAQLSDNWMQGMISRNPTASKQQLEILHGEYSQANPDYGLRPDGTKKGSGFFGPLRLPDGSVATEYSMQSEAVKKDGKMVDFPTLVPTLTKEERDLMVNDIIPNKKPIPDGIAQKAVDFAQKRMSEGKPLFATDEESPKSGSSGAKGIRNNNPGNIVKTSSQWGGETQSDGRFKSFESPEAGIAAIGKNLLSYQSKGVDTVSAIINKWAPPSENDTDAYVASVAKELGVQPDQKLDLKDPAVMASLSKAIIRHENGSQPYSDDQIKAGVDSALSGKAPATASTMPISPVFDHALKNIPADKIPSYLAMANQQERGNLAEMERARAERDRIKREAQDSILSGMLTKLNSNSLSIDEVLKNPTLDFAHKEHMVNAIKSVANNQDKSDPSVFNGLVNRIYAAPSDPNRITDPDSFLQFIGHGISRTDVDWLRNELARKHDPEYQQLGKFKEMAHKMLSKASMLMADPEGERLYYEWNYSTEKLMQQKLKEGKSLDQLLDPASSEYLGKTIKPRSIQDAITSQANALRESVPNQVADDMKRKPNETIEEWQARTNDFGKLGATFDKAMGN